MDRYQKLEKIGEGGSALVYKGHDTENNKTVALKEINIFVQNEGVPSMVIREVSLLKEMEHNNIVRLLDVVVSTESRVCLVFEYMDLDLKKFMDTFPAIAKDPRVIKRFLHQILQGVAYCHSHKILHRDLKPKNLLIDRSNNVLKIADFGLARAVGAPLMTYTNGVGTPYYRAPELLLGSRKYSKSVDLWSVGCIFAEMVTHQPLFAAPNEFRVLVTIFSIMGTPSEETWPGVTLISDYLHLFDKCDSKNLADIVPGLESTGMDLLSKMLCMYPRGRITAQEALEHEYFKDVETIT